MMICLEYLKRKLVNKDKLCWWFDIDDGTYIRCHHSVEHKEDSYCLEDCLIYDHYDRLEYFDYIPGCIEIKNKSV